MDQLPFLVVHGAWLSKALPLTVAAAGSALLWLVRRRRDLHRARRATRVRAAAATPLSQGNVTLRAIWREHDGPWLDCQGERVDLDGATIRRGTRARWRWRDPGPHHQVRDGDAVVATGRLARRTHRTDTYREPAGRWVLGPVRALVPVEILAVSPVACPRPLGPKAILLYAAFAAAAYVPLRALGESQLHHVGFTHERTLRALDPLDPLVIAAALPGTRDKALLLLADVFDREIVRTPETIDLSIALARLRGCTAELSALLEDGRFEAAVERAQACGDADRHAEALLSLGRFDEAIETAYRDTGPYEQRSIAAIGAGRWTTAAAVLDQRMTTTWQAPGATGIPDAGMSLACIADLFRIHGGDPAAARRLHQRAGWPNAGCKIANALLLPVHEQAAALAAIHSDLADDAHLQRTVDLLLWTLRGDPLDHEPFVSTLLDQADHETRHRFTDGREAWFAPFALPTDAPSAHAWAAVRHAYLGAWAAAHAEVRRLRDDLPADEAPLIDPRALDIEIHLREAATPVRFEHIDEYSTAEHTAKQHAALRAGFVNFDLMRTLKLYADEDFVPAQAVLQAAADGNGAPLATVVEHNAAPWTHVAGIVIAVLPRIAAREPLATAVRTIGLPPLHHLFDFLGSLAMRRDLARAIDDDATAARCQAILDRYATMLADRDKAIAIALLDP